MRNFLHQQSNHTPTKTSVIPADLQLLGFLDGFLEGLLEGLLDMRQLR